MTDINTSLDNKPFVDLREGASILGLAILMPLAVEGSVVAGTWALTTMLTGEPYPSGLNLTDGTTLALMGLMLFLVRFVWWSYLALRHERQWWVGLLAAIPLVGIVWAISLSATAVRSRAQARELSTVARGSLILTLVVALLLLPFGVASATAEANEEQARLAAPCLADAPTVFPGSDPVVTVGMKPIDRMELNDRVEQVRTRQDGPVAKRDPRLPVRVLEASISLEVWDALARSKALTTSLGDADRAFEAEAASAGGRTALLDSLAQSGYAESSAPQIACFFAYWDELTAGITPSAGETDEQARDRVFIETAAKNVTSLSEEFGFWDPKAASIVASKPLKAAVNPEVKRTYAAKVTYDNANIPTQEFKDTLAWNTDICVSGTTLRDKQYLDKVGLFERVGEGWVAVRDTKPETKAGGRCPSGSTNLIIASSAPEPQLNWTDKGWTTCRPYQVRLPEMPAFRATSIDFCVSAQANTEGGTS